MTNLDLVLNAPQSTPKAVHDQAGRFSDAANSSDCDKHIEAINFALMHDDGNPTRAGPARTVTLPSHLLSSNGAPFLRPPTRAR